MKAKGGLSSFFRKEPLNCDHVYNVLGEIFGFIDYEKHLNGLLQSQEILEGDIGAWSEYFIFPKGNEAPMATAEAVLALLNFSQRSETSHAIKKACRYLIQTQDENGGWKDLVDHSVTDATGCVLTALSEVKKVQLLDIPEKTLRNALNFIVSNQNDDGGWGTVKGEKSKIHYTYFALWGLASSKTLLPIKEEANIPIKKGIDWIEKNSKRNYNKGVSLSMEDAPSLVATALAILCCLNVNKKNLVKQQWIDFIKESIKNNGWNEISDESLVYKVRRVYNFRSIPWIVEALVRTKEKLDSEIITSALHKLRDFESPSGGFVSNVGKTTPVVWHTAWFLRMAHYLMLELQNNLRLYVENIMKKNLEMTEKLVHLEHGSKPGTRIITIFGVFSAVLVAVSTYLLRLATSSSYGKLVWLPFAAISSFIIMTSIAYYWNEIKELNKFRSFLLAITWG